MSEKVSTITLRLTAEEVTQLEILKNLTGKRTASEAIKHVVREYPRFCTHYKQEAKEHGELKRRYGTRQVGESGQGERVGEMIASKIRSGRSWPMKYLLSYFSGSCARAA